MRRRQGQRRLHGALRWLLPPLLALACAGSPAAERVHVMALFDGRALVEVDGQRRMLVAGGPAEAGVRLIEANSTVAVLEVDGRRGQYRLGSRIGGTYRPPERATVRIVPDRAGMYRIDGRIDGHPVEFLVDTGATYVAMNAGQARAMGLAFRVDGTPMTIRTASGLARGYRLRLGEVTVGAISLREVDAVVVDGASPDQALLGMSFLGQLELQRNGPVMVLRKNH